MAQVTQLMKRFPMVVAGSLLASVIHAETVVGILKSKQHIVELFAEEDGPRYSVKDENGELLASKLTGDALIEQFPRLESLIRGYAADDASLSPKLNHTVDILNDGS